MTSAISPSCSSQGNRHCPGLGSSRSRGERGPRGERGRVGCPCPRLRSAWRRPDHSPWLSRVRGDGRGTITSHAVMASPLPVGHARIDRFHDPLFNPRGGSDRTFQQHGIRARSWAWKLTTFARKGLSARENSGHENGRKAPRGSSAGLRSTGHIFDATPLLDFPRIASHRALPGPGLPHGRNAACSSDSSFAARDGTTRRERPEGRSHATDA